FGVRTTKGDHPPSLALQACIKCLTRRALLTSLKRKRRRAAPKSEIAKKVGVIGILTDTNLVEPCGPSAQRPRSVPLSREGVAHVHTLHSPLGATTHRRSAAHLCVCRRILQWGSQC